MAFTYIAKAMAVISRIPNTGLASCDWISARFNAMNINQIKTIDDSLNFGWLRMHVDPTAINSREEIANIRRAAKLQVDLLQAAGVVPPEADKRIVESWDSDDLRGLIRKNCAQQPGGLGVGYRLQGSYWGFAKTTEIEWTKAAWVEAKDMINWGIIVAANAHNHSPHSKALFTTWFGNNLEIEVFWKLRQMLDDMALNTVPITYQGLGAATNTSFGNQKYQEKINNAGHAVELTVDAQNWGWANEAARTLGFGVKYFNDQTRIRQTQQHAKTSREMEVTRGGAMVHELSHRILRTIDADVPNGVYAHLGRPNPLPGKRAKGYGPYTCAALAEVAPQLALDNADNYRLFCEDAFYLKPA